MNDNQMFGEIDKAVAEKFSNQAEDKAPAEAKSETSVDTAPESKSEAQALFDLSKADKFLLDGKEYTKDQLIKERLLHSDYTRKTQEFAEQRRQFEETQKYDVNLKSDIRAVLQDPSLVTKFKQVYPKEYHDIVDMYLEKLQGSGPKTQGTTSDLTSIQKLVEDQIKPLKEEWDRTKTEAETKKLDALFSSLATKYPDAKDEFVLARLQTLASQGVQVDDAKVEEVFKFLDEDRKKDRESYHKEQLNKQIEANKRGKDVASGGGIPGQAPKKFSMSNTKEIEQAMIQHLQRQS